MPYTVIPPCASPPSIAEGGTFFYTEPELDLIDVVLGRAARGLLRTTPVLVSWDGCNYCQFSKRTGPLVFYTAEARFLLPVVMHEAGHAYHVYMLRGLSLVAPTWRCEAFAYYTVLRAYDVLLKDGLNWRGFAEYLAAHEALAPRAVGLARVLMDEPPARAVRLALAGDGYAA